MAQATAEHQRRDRHAVRVLARRVGAGATARCTCEARVRMRRPAPAIGGPLFAAPVGQAVGRGAVDPLPPDIAVVGERHIGEDRVAGDGRHCVGIGLQRGAGDDAEIPRLRVDGAQPALRVRPDPRDVVAHRRRLPALVARRGDQHGEVGLAAGTRKRGGDIGLLPPGRLDAEDQHMFGQPALVARHHRGEAQREALLAQKRVAAVARTVGPDLAVLGVVDDVFLVVARPWRIRRAIGQRRAERMHATHEIAVAQRLQRRPAHPRHQFHARRHIGRVGQLHAEARHRRTQRSHRERNHIERAPAHGAVEAGAQGPPHRRGVDPIVVGPRIFLGARTDEGASLDPRRVRGRRTREETPRPLFRIERDQGSRLDHSRA